MNSDLSVVDSYTVIYTLDNIFGTILPDFQTSLNLHHFNLMQPSLYLTQCWDTEDQGINNYYDPNSTGYANKTQDWLIATNPEQANIPFIDVYGINEGILDVNKAKRVQLTMYIGMRKEWKLDGNVQNITAQRESVRQVISSLALVDLHAHLQNREGGTPSLLRPSLLQCVFIRNCFPHFTIGRGENLNAGILD